jgi:formylglycine-generating enzyme required for sulfatase activity
MAWIEPGRFTMGSPVTEYRRLPNEDNRTVVRFKQGFWMGTKEVSQALWLRIMGNNPSPAGGPDHPVVAISWTEAKAFCERLNRFEADAGRLPDGYAYRLPTEAEWEYAARAGSSTPFSFGATASPTRGNFSGVYDPSQNGLEAVPDPSGTLPCGSFPPNAWGLYDVHGNVAEWTLDLYWDRLPGGAVSDPVNLARGRGHPIRGGGWSSPAHSCRSSARDSLLSDSSRNWVGLRVVLAPRLQQDG